MENTIKTLNLLKLSTLLTLLILSACRTDKSQLSPEAFPNLSGAYLGQNLPDTIPGLFANNIVSTDMFTRDVAISPDGKEIYWGVSLGNYKYTTIVFSREVAGQWTRPELVAFSGGPGIMDLEPAFSPDGSRLYFLSTRPDGDEEVGDQDIWYVERQGEGWGEAVNPGAPLNTDGGEFFPSLTEKGTLYFTRNEKGSRLNQVFRSQLVDDVFQEPELLPEEVNCGTNRFNAFVAPDESYIIVPAAGMEDAFDGVDYYIVFRNARDHWSKPVNLGKAVNDNNARGWSPYVSPDGKAFFFMAVRPGELDPSQWNYETLQKYQQGPENGNSDIYWMDASFIEDLKKSSPYS